MFLLVSCLKGEENCETLQCPICCIVTELGEEVCVDDHLLCKADLTHDFDKLLYAILIIILIFSCFPLLALMIEIAILRKIKPLKISCCEAAIKGCFFVHFLRKKQKLRKKNKIFISVVDIKTQDSLPIN